MSRCNETAMYACNRVLKITTLHMYLTPTHPHTHTHTHTHTFLRHMSRVPLHAHAHTPISSGGHVCVRVCMYVCVQCITCLSLTCALLPPMRCRSYLSGLSSVVHASYCPPEYATSAFITCAPTSRVTAQFVPDPSLKHTHTQGARIRQSHTRGPESGSRDAARAVKRVRVHLGFLRTGRDWVPLDGIGWDWATLGGMQYWAVLGATARFWEAVGSNTR